MRYLFLFLLLTLIASCSNEVQQSNEPVTDTLTRVPTGQDVYPAFKDADSVQVLYYKNPFGADSLRYYRFFTYLATTDTTVLATIQDALAAPVNGWEQQHCRSEGKIYLLRGDDVIKTIYFNLQPGSCNHLYFIKDGNFYYLPITDALTRLLQALRLQAKEPPSELAELE